MIFYVEANQKWKYQQVYELFQQDKRFEPLIVVSIIKEAHTGVDKLVIICKKITTFLNLEI